MKHALHAILTAAFLLPATLSANTAPTVVIQSATMRPGTTLMDVVYRVNDPDNATVKTRALAFVDGVRSFVNVLKPVTFVEGTAAKLGDAIPANVNHTLTWDVAADWNIDLGQVKFEVLAMDGRGLLPFDWITIPAAAGNPALTVSKNSPTDAEVLNALFWQYASGDSWLSLANGILTGNSSSGVFNQLSLANGSSPQTHSTPFIFKRMNVDPADSANISYAGISARAGLSETANWHAANRPYMGISPVAGWGSNSDGKTAFSFRLPDVIGVEAGDSHSLALKSDGTVVGWGANNYGQTTIPVGLSGVIAIAARRFHSLALKSNGTVVGWGLSEYGSSTIPAGLTDVTAIAAGSFHSLALKIDGTVVGWGNDAFGQTTIPAGLSGVTAIAAGHRHSLALKSDGTVVVWGENGAGQTTTPTGLIGVIAVAGGETHSLALKSDGTVVGWGGNYFGQITIPAGLTGCIAIDGGQKHSLALKNDGTVVGWGGNDYGQISIPVGLTGVTAISAGLVHSLAVKAKAP